MNQAKRQNNISIVRLVVRSAILASFSPILTQGDFLSSKALQSLSGVVVALLLYGVELLMLRIGGQSPISNNASAAASRGAALLCVLSLLEFGSLGRAVGSAIGGAILALILYGIETAIIKVGVRKSKNDNA